MSTATEIDSTPREIKHSDRWCGRHTARGGADRIHARPQMTRNRPGARGGLVGSEQSGALFWRLLTRGRLVVLSSGSRAAPAVHPHRDRFSPARRLAPAGPAQEHPDQDPAGPSGRCEGSGPGAFCPYPRLPRSARPMESSVLIAAKRRRLLSPASDAYPSLKYPKTASTTTTRPMT